ALGAIGRLALVLFGDVSCVCIHRLMQRLGRDGFLQGRKEFFLDLNHGSDTVNAFDINVLFGQPKWQYRQISLQPPEPSHLHLEGQSRNFGWWRNCASGLPFGDGLTDGERYVVPMRTSTLRMSFSVETIQTGYHGIPQRFKLHVGDLGDVLVPPQAE